jgi:hypothetical protein
MQPPAGRLAARTGWDFLRAFNLRAIDMTIVAQKRRKLKRGEPPIDYFRPVSDVDRRIVAVLAQGGYTVMFDYLKRPGTQRRWLTGYSRVIVAREGSRDGR